MIRNWRSQVEPPERTAHFRALSGISCPPEGDMTRQEFKEDCDLNSVLRRYGALPTPVQPTPYGELNTDLDLQTAYEALRAAETAYEGLPLGLRQKFPSWALLAQAMAAGELDHLNPDGTPRVPKEPERVPPEKNAEPSHNGESTKGAT